MEFFYPTQVMNLIETFRICFTKPTWGYFLGYIWALILSPERKCMTRLAYICFPIQKSLSSWERFLAEYKWNLNLLIEQLVKLLLSQLGKSVLYANKFLVTVVDTTLIAKASSKMFGIQNWHDSSSNPDRGATIKGHHWGILGILNKWKDRWLCWPVMARLITTKGQWKQGEKGIERMSFWDLVHSMIYHLLGLINYSLIVIADAYFSKAPFLNPMIEAGVTVISRLRSDSIGWDSPEPNPPGKRGPKPKLGREWKLSRLLKEMPLQISNIPIYGKIEEISYVSRIVWLREVKEKVSVVIIKTSTPVILICTNIELTPVQIIELYASRFSIEITIRELKSNLGLCDYQTTSYLAIRRFIQLSFVAFSVWRLALLKSLENTEEWLNLTSQISFISESPLSFQRIRRSLRCWVIRKMNYTNFAPLPNFHNSSYQDSLIERFIA